MKENAEVKITLDFIPETIQAEIKEKILSGVCPYCFGSGKVKVMQNYMTYDAGTIRGPDTYIDCPFCNGTGRRK